MPPLNVPIILKRSAVPGKVPTADQLEYGELAINYADGVLQFKTVDNEIAAFPQAPKTITATAGASYNIDLLDGRVQTVRLTLNQASTSITFSNAKDGQKFILELTQGTGNNAIVWPASFRLAPDLVSGFQLSTDVGYLDRIGLTYVESAGKFDVVAYSLGYQP